MKLKIILLAVFNFFLLAKNIAQPAPYQKSFGDSLTNEFGISVIQLSSGSIFFCGYKYNAQLLAEISITKLDAFGNIQWQQYYNDSIQSFTSGKMIFHNNKFFVAGQSMYPNGNVDALILCVDTSGNLLWTKKYGGLSTNESFAGIEADSVFGFMCTGFATAGAGSGNDIYIARIDTNGNKIWDATYGSLLNDVSMAIKKTQDGNFILSGDKLIPSTSNYNAYVMKIDSAGNFIWDADIVNNYNSGCRNIMVNHNGDNILVGESATPTSSYFDVMISKITATGNVAWTKTITGTDFGDAGFSVIETSPFHYLITGYGYNTNDSSTDVVLLHVDSAGNEISKRYYNYSQLDFGFEITSSIYGGFLIAGTNYGADNQYYLIYDTLSIPVGIKEQTATKNNLVVTPTIVHKNDFIHFNKAVKNFDITIVDLSGKTVYTDYVNASVTEYKIKSHFVNGNYILKIHSPNFELKTKLLFTD